MAGVELGKVYELKSNMVTERAINILRAVIEARAEVFFFDCKLCGAVRQSNVIDPGVLMFRQYVCADMNKRCQSPPTPKALKRLITLRPGSLVIAPIDPTSEKMWPGIIEDCPEGTEGYCIAGETKDTVKAYFVTFIFPNEPSRRWLGGFIASQKIVPLEQHQTQRSAGLANTEDLLKSLDRANKAAHLSLRQRLLEFSFVAHVATSRDIPMAPKNKPSFWSMFFGKGNTADEARPESLSRTGRTLPSYHSKLVGINEMPEETGETDQAPRSSNIRPNERPKTPATSRRSSEPWTSSERPDDSY